MSTISSSDQNKLTPSRQYYLDWTRSSAVHLVLVLHTVLTTDKITGESERNEGFKERKLAFFRYLIQFGIPTFFMLSGIGASNFKTEKHGFTKYGLDKLKRLGFPFFLSLFVFLIPRLYVA